MNAFLANLYLRALAVRDREEGQAMAEYGIILALSPSACWYYRSSWGRSRECFDQHHQTSSPERKYWVVVSLPFDGITAHLSTCCTEVIKHEKTTNRPEQEWNRKMKYTKTNMKGNERGQAMVEFAMVLPLLIPLVFGIIQFAIVFNHP